MAIDKSLPKYMMAIKPTLKAQLPFYEKLNCHFMKSSSAILWSAR